MREFWFLFNNGAESLQLPVNPPSVEIDSGHGFTDVEIAGLGEFTVIGNPTLKVFRFSSHFPKFYDAGYQISYPDLLDPWDCVKQVEAWQHSGRPMRLIVTGTPINHAVTVRSFNYREEGLGDIYFDIEFKEYRFVEVKTSTSSTGTKPTPTGSKGTRPPVSETKTKTYTVKSGDTLYKIASKQLGSGSKWKSIYDLNKKLIGSNPDKLKIGTTLKLP
jgi:nucleoid-associated protein YgaU